MKNFSNYKDVPTSILWGTLAAPLIAIVWLLPNHAFPWTTFHSDAWISILLGGLGALALAKSFNKVHFYGSNIFTGFSVFIPIVQFYTGQLPLIGLAVMPALYLLGFTLAQIAGQQCQIWQPKLFGNLFFSAVGIASIVSVGIQIYQWVGLARDSGITDIWILDFDGSRPFGNLGQPNQLSTLLLWGLIACIWGLLFNYIGVFVSVFFSGFVTFGLVLAQSRTAILGLVFLILSCLLWRPLKNIKPVKVFAFSIGFFYALYFFLIQYLSKLLLLDGGSSIKGRSEGELRPAAYRMFFDALGEHPWFGYGWNQVMSAHLWVGYRHPDVGHLFGQTHNVFLDFFIWSGIPIGILISIVVLLWITYAAYKITSTEDAIYFLCILVVGIHALLELPLHYAYFLIPVGYFVGIINSNIGIAKINLSKKLSALIACILYTSGFVLLLVVIRDYLLVEKSTEIVRFENSRVRVKEPAKSPDVLLLNQLGEQINFFIYEPKSGAQEADLKRARVLATTYPSHFNIMKTITLLSLNGYEQEAKKWMCAAPFVMDRQARQSLQVEWGKIQVQHFKLMSIEWTAGDSCLKFR